MKRIYAVSKDDKSSLWYAHMVDFPKIPIFGSFSKNKKAAQKHAANKMGITLKEYYKTKNGYVDYSLVAKLDTIYQEKGNNKEVKK